MTHAMKPARSLLCLAALTALAVPSRADVLDDAISARLLPGWRAADGSHVAAIEMILAPGWKTYWRAPGDAGIPPRFDWQGSENLADIAVSWPTPMAMVSDGLKSIGYDERVVLPLHVEPRHAGQDVHLTAQLDIGVCRDVCLPMTLDVAQLLPASATSPDPRIAAALADRPHTASEAGLGRIVCTLTPGADGLHLRAELDLPATGGREVAVVETDNPMIWVAQARAQREGERLTVETELFHAEGGAFALNRNGLRLTVLGSSRAVDIKGCPGG